MSVSCLDLYYSVRYKSKATESETQQIETDSEPIVLGAVIEDVEEATDGN